MADTDPCPVPRGGWNPLSAGPWDTVVSVTYFQATCHQLNKFPILPWWWVTFSWNTAVVTVGTWWQELHWAELGHGQDEGAGSTVVTQVVALMLS